MTNQKPALSMMIRARFLSSILSPLIAGTLLAATINESFSILGFLFVLIMGIGLHAATNVYNDIYDTIQGTDKINVHRNEFSGGSGTLLTNPELMPTLYKIARISLLIALAATIALMFVVKKELWLHLWILYGLSAFFSKYYTAAPVKLAYRGLGEFFVWFAFGPMAIMVAAVSQNVGFHPTIITALPITGISTLSILLIGQMIDLDADKATGKHGISARKGNKVTAYFYLSVQLFAMLNIVVLSFMIPNNGFFVLIALIPYLIFLPKVWKIMQQHFDNADETKKAAMFNVQLHLFFALLFSMGIGLTFIF